MRSFEFVEGSSAKFWEISREGGEVTVRFGRVGTQGQVSVKTLADEAAAAAHETKQINDKLRKGYVETTAASSPPVVAVPSAPSVSAAPASSSAVSYSAASVSGAASASGAAEDVFVFPSAWLRHRSPRRGGDRVGSFAPGPKARGVVEAKVADARGHVDAILDAPTTAESTAHAARQWLSGSPEASPLGAAAVAAAAYSYRWAGDEWANPFADVWIAERGLVFAAEAAVTFMALTVIDDNNPPAAGNWSNGTPGVRHLRPGETRQGWYADPAIQALLRVRQALAAAPEDDYAAVLTVLSGYREAILFARAAVSVLAPERRDWFEQDRAEAVRLSDAYLSALLLTAAATPADVRELFPVADDTIMTNAIALLATLVDGTGAAAAPALFHWLDEAVEAETRKRLLSALTVLPADEVTAGLIERADAKYVTPALIAHGDRFPARTLRLLADVSARRGISGLLRAHVLKHRDLAAQIVTRLAPEAAARVREILDDTTAIAPAPLSAVPPVLADPPWTRPIQRAKPIIITGLACDDQPTMAWEAGERERWAALTARRYAGDRTRDPAIPHNVVIPGHLSLREAVGFLFDLPDDLARKALAEWRPDEAWAAESYLRPVAARFETDALPMFLALGRSAPGETGLLFRPFAAPQVAALMADWFTRLKTVREEALDWLRRHPAAAARALIPPALGKAGVARRQAETALLALRDNGHADTVREAARGYGPDAAAAVEVLLATDPAALVPVKIPPIPAWATPEALGPVILRDRAGSLPPAPAAALITMLAMSRLETPHAGLAEVRAACEPGSLAGFAWSLFEQWRAAGSASKDNWTLDALGLLGDDDTVRRLSPLILAWPGEGGHQRAITGLHVLARIGSDVALMHLHTIAQRAKFSALKHAAQQMMQSVAEGLGLTSEQLADRLVPDFGLDADGSLRLDYGPRQFVVGFDEQLRPYVTDTAGKTLKTLPKPGVRDDALLAPAAYQRFTGLKKDVRTIAADQVRRLERAMVTNRRWSGAEFRQLFAGHPLLWHIVRRLVWATFTADGTPAGAFRIAEDRTLSTVDDEETTLADDAVVGVAHPLHLGADVAAWGEVFADYEILQPFPQLGRPVFTLAEAEVSGSRLTRFEGTKVPATKLLGMERRGWQRESPQDAGVQSRLEFPVPDGLQIIVDFEPGIAIGGIDYFPEQHLRAIWLQDASRSRWARGDKGHVTLKHLDPVTISELLRDLTDLTT
ncbi:WGR domain-containing protein, predicted DNA-binding domain in MolR [Actinoplanes philippinensis]|uniref:WGR domain-containing protein, predicted DNA-binding domain in MolR n=1 Tax=Actinoplanes philippinensis TaxID=35752 RepID=A0A1I2MIM8_9ACTN|nr:WGR domain-containing protein, predicted DNA-binding domain in MolR [Actinoplanes philippinensis]